MIFTFDHLKPIVYFAHLHLGPILGLCVQDQRVVLWVAGWMLSGTAWILLGFPMEKDRASLLAPRAERLEYKTYSGVMMLRDKAGEALSFAWVL